MINIYFKLTGVGGRGRAGAPAVRPVVGDHRDGHGSVTVQLLLMEAASVQDLRRKYFAAIQNPALLFS